MTPSDARRILVAGTSGSGKTTLAAKIATATGITHTEIDGLYHHAGWTLNQRFQEEVQALIAGEAWITELQYRTVRQMLAERAQLLIWLDLPRHVVLRRIVMRTVQRSVLRVELWNGNFEPPLRTIFTDRDHIVRWSMRTHSGQAQAVRDALATNPLLRLVRVRSNVDIRRLLALLAVESTRSFGLPAG